MFWQPVILAAVLTWLSLASPSAAAAAQRTSGGIEVRNGTRTVNLARLTRSLLSQEGFDVIQIGNHIDFGAEATVISYRAEAEEVARQLKSKIFPGAKLEESSNLKNGVDVKVVLGHDLLAQPILMARLLGEGEEAASHAVNAETPESGAPDRSRTVKGTVAPALVSASAKPAPNVVQIESQPPVPADGDSGAIRRHIDSSGVVHIGNVPAKAVAALHESPAAPAGAPSEVAVLPQPVQPQPSQPNDASIESDLDHIAQVCEDLTRGETQPHEFDGIIAAAAQAVAEKEVVEVAELVVDYNYLPPRQLTRQPGAMVAPEAAAPKPADTAMAGNIQRFRDAQGVLHISNAHSGGLGLTPTIQMTSRPAAPRNVAGERAPIRPVVAAPLQVRPAAWDPDEAELASLPVTAAPARKATAGTVNPIRSYKDSKGVIHISNVEPEREAAPPSSMQARNGSGEGTEAPGLRRAQRQFDLEGAWILRPAAWNADEGLKLLKRKTPESKAASKKMEITSEGGIRRYRDKQGVVHIKTVEHPLPPGVVLPARQGGPVLSPPAVAPPAAAALASLPVVPNPAPSAVVPPANQPTAPGVARVTAFRDSKGRLRITTEMPQVDPGKAPAPTVASAELEPIIQEAAQIHRLPATLIRAVIKVESNFCSWAVSPKGAMGCMQLMPGTANLLGVQEPFNPRQNILGGSRYLRDLINMFGGNLPLALAAYNAGFQRVIDCGYQIPSIKETQDFVTSVMGRYVADEKRARQPVI